MVGRCCLIRDYIFFVRFSPVIKSRNRAHLRKFYCTAFKNQGLVLGLYEPAAGGQVGKLTPAAQKVNRDLGDKLQQVLSKCVEKSLKLGKVRLLHGLHGTFSSIAVVGLGADDCGDNEREERDEAGHNIRVAVANGVRQLRDVGLTSVLVDPSSNPQAAAEGATLALFSFDELKLIQNRQPVVALDCYTAHLGDSTEIKEKWSRGVTIAEGQNFARYLMESPANLMTPTLFVDEVTKRMTNLKVDIYSRDKEWMEKERMRSFLSVSQGSVEEPKLLELRYNGGGSEAPVALVGKGITFDSGGISLKTPLDMDLMRGDMGGAACVAGTLLTVARLQLPINVYGFAALSENMPGCRATKPGDVFTARNGKSIQVMNTDAEGRLVLADALNYAESLNPTAIISIATLTGAMQVALGSAVTGTFSRSTPLWETIHQAGMSTGDRLWRMPLMKHYTRNMTDCLLADLDNVGNAGRLGGSCTAAAFLGEFVTHDAWMHLDIAGVMYNKSPSEYLGKGMTGRPTRTLVEFLRKRCQDKS